MNRKHLGGATGALALSGLFVLAAWGPLDPPDGPIAPTGKTLTEVEPRIPLNAQTAPGDLSNLFVIEKSGSYYLTGNITGVSGKSGIHVSANRVTLDLNGFALEGIDGSIYGIHSNGNHGVSIRNGSIYNWKYGVTVQETLGCRLENLTSSGNFSYGFQVGAGATVRDCTAVNCTPGFDVHWDATLTNCTAVDGGARGFDIGEGATLSHCQASRVATGFYIAGPAVLDNCTSRDNSSHGFHAEESAVLTDCSAYGNALMGFRIIARSRVTRCLSRTSGVTGFYLVEGNSLVECTAAGNGGDGVYIAGNANTVERGTFHENLDDGIFLFSGAGNSIDGNLVTYNKSIGIEINSTDNLTVRNRARGNTLGNYQFVANTDYGVILTNPGAGFVSSAAWANFAY